MFFLIVSVTAKKVYIFNAGETNKYNEQPRPLVTPESDASQQHILKRIGKWKQEEVNTKYVIWRFWGKKKHNLCFSLM